MTRYNREELEGDWEFKILRSATNAFRNPNTLAAALETEAIGGWQLVEKFDDGRLRLKRPASAQRNDATLPAGYDPYRTRYGMGEGSLALVIMAAIFLVIGIGVAVAVFFGALTF